jgi:hypothetical protein
MFGGKAKQELSLREEMDDILFGTKGSVPKSFPFILRNLRRDSFGTPEKCTCYDLISRDSDPDCVYCLGEGYLWDEVWKKGRSEFLGAEGGLANKYRYAQPGLIRADYKIFFFRYDTAIQYGDKIIEPKLDLEGKVITPYVRQAIYKPQTIDFLRSDSGRVEYIAVYCLENDAIRSDN